MATKLSPYETVSISKKHSAVVKADAEMQRQIYENLIESQLKDETRRYEARQKLERKFLDEIADLQAEHQTEEIEKQLEQKKEEYENLLKQDRAYETQRLAIESKARDAAIVKSKNDYILMNADKRRELSANIAEELKLRSQQLQAEIEMRRDAYDSLPNDDDKKASTKLEIDALQAELIKIQQQAELASDMSTRLNKSEILKNSLTTAGRAKLMDNMQKQTVAADDQYKLKKSDYDEKKLKFNEKNLEIEKKIQSAIKERNEEKLKAAQDEMEHLHTVSKEKKERDEAEQELKEAHLDRTEKQLKQTGAAFGTALANGVSKFVDAAGRTIESNLDALFGSQGKMMGRLQGTTLDWAEMVDSVSDTIGFSGVVSKKSVVSKMVELVDSGVAYNIEMRAFLSETAENIAATFSATNGTLLRLIRIQQQDTTAARLGMEAALTKLFNNFFNDTSYLAEDVSESISATLLDASATMSRDASLEFEYTMQKWLGSLYSLGMSQEGVSKIAEGIGYLATGNVSALNSNESLQTLLAMSASKANKSYAGLLLGNLTADDTNDLLKAMVEYLAEIASSQTNYVTKSAYANLFGMSMTDLNSFTSLTQKELESLYESTVSYSSLMNETQNQLNEVTSRIHLSKLVDNAFDNALVGAASTIGSNAFLYGTWKTLAVLKEYVGEIKIPGIIGMGTGISSGLDILNLAQTGMVGIGLLGSLLGGIGSMFNGGPTNFDYIKNAWNYQEATSRGGNLSILETGDTFNQKSYSATLGVGSQSGEDAEAVAMQSGMDKGSEVTSDEMEEQKEIYQRIYEALAMDDGAVTVLSVLGEINNRLDPNRVFYTASLGSVASATANKILQLSSELTAATATVSNTAPSTEAASSASNTTQSSATDGIGGEGKTVGNVELVTLEDTIKMAVQAAVQTLLDSYTHTGIPVRVTTSSM